MGAVVSGARGSSDARDLNPVQIDVLRVGANRIAAFITFSSASSAVLVHVIALEWKFGLPKRIRWLDPDFFTHPPNVGILQRLVFAPPWFRSVGV